MGGAYRKGQGDGDFRGGKMSEKDLCNACNKEWINFYGSTTKVCPWSHCHHDQPGPQPSKEEVKPSCKWCETWKRFRNYVFYLEDAEYLITLDQYLQLCPVCGGKL